MTSERLEVARTIEAEPAAIFRVLCDPQGHVAIDSTGMLMDATGEPVTAAGDTFVVHMDREALNDYPLGRYDVTVTITTLVPDREIAWTVKGRIRPQVGHVYGYRLEPAGDAGTLVTSYYDWSSIHPHWREAGIFPVVSEAALRATLGILARTVARGYIGRRTLPCEAYNAPRDTRDWEGLVYLFDLSGKVAVVTGGTRGIGMMMARGLLQAGAAVYISSRKPEAGEAAAKELSQYGTVISVPADLSREEECLRLAGEVGQNEEGIHVLVNNAGANWGAPLEEFPAHGWDKVVDLNLKTPFYLTRAFLPLLEADGTADDPARVINVGSIDGLHVPPFQTYSYASSKAGLHQLTRVLARELGPRHITVNAVAPGPFESKMMAATLAARGDEIAAGSPLGRIGRPDDMAGVAVFLSGRGSAYITGAVIPVDGGIWAAS